MSAMTSEALDELLDHLERTTRLSRREAERVVAEVASFFSESTEEFVTRRHEELRRERLRNPVIFERIAGELQARRVAPPRLTQRQLRRIVYG
jgi:uncharacterized protein YdaU (DUF1376 family)